MGDFENVDQNKLENILINQSYNKDKKEEN